MKYAITSVASVAIVSASELDHSLAAIAEAPRSVRNATNAPTLAPTASKYGCAAARPCSSRPQPVTNRGMTVPAMNWIAAPMPPASACAKPVIAPLTASEPRKTSRLPSCTFSTSKMGAITMRLVCPIQSWRFDTMPSKVMDWASIMPPNFCCMSPSTTCIDSGSGLSSWPDLLNSRPILARSSRLAMPSSAMRAIASPVAPVENLPSSSDISSNDAPVPLAVSPAIVRICAALKPNLAAASADSRPNDWRILSALTTSGSSNGVLAPKSASSARRCFAASAEPSKTVN